MQHTNLLSKLARIIPVLLLTSAFTLISCGGESGDQDTAQQQTQQQDETTQQQQETETQTQQQDEPADTETQAEESEDTEQESQAAETQQQEAPAQETQQMEPLNIEVPKAMFVGTPTNMNVPNLEQPRGEPRPPFMAPAGTENVALNQPVSSTDEMPIIGEIAMITDGDKSAADGSYVELGPFLQHATVDLGEANNIYAIVLWHFHKQPRVYYDVIVQVSDDPDFIENVTTIFNNDIDNSAGLGVGQDKHYVETNEGKLIDAQGVQGRYVRAYSNGNNSNDLNHYIEIAVYGKPI